MTSPNQLSFLPDDYLQKKAARRATVLGAALFMVVAAGIGAAFLVTDRGTRQIERDHDAVVTQYTEAARRIEQVKVLQEKQRKMATQAELTASLLEKVPRGNLLADITNSMPVGLSLLEFTLESRAVAPPPPKPQSAMTVEEQKKALEEKEKLKAGGTPPPQPKLYDVFLKLTGVARTDVQVAQFIAKLGTSKLLKDVNLVISDEYKLQPKANPTGKEAKDAKDEEKLRKFQIECMVNPAAQVTAAEVAKSRAAKNATAAVELGTK
jgi:hypothetical protein